MASKEAYCYRLFKKYSLIVDFDENLSDLDYGVPIPNPIAKETYGSWKARVLGDCVKNVVLYAPSEPTDKTWISTLQSRTGTNHLEKFVGAIKSAERKQKKTAVNAAIKETHLKLTTFPRDALEDLVAASKEVLEPSVTEFFDRFLKNCDSNIDTEKIIAALLKAYNEAVRVQCVMEAIRIHREAIR
jgi:hypothetical protein